MIESAVLVFGGTMYFTGVMRSHLNKKAKQRKLYKLAKKVAKRPDNDLFFIENAIKEIMQ